MSIQEVIQACQIVADSGKKPTIGLVKAQLSNRLPLALVIRGVKQYLANPSIAKRDNETQNALSQREEARRAQSLEKECSCTTQISLLQVQVDQLSQALIKLQAEVTALNLP